MLAHRPILFALFTGAVVLVLAAFVLLSSREDDAAPDTGALASPTPAATETPAPAPSATAEELARNFALQEVTGEATFITGGMPVPDGLGVYYQDVATGAIEGWGLLLPGTHIEAFSGDNRFNVIRRREQLFQNGVIYYAGAYLADRATGKVYWLPGVTPVFSTSDFNGRNLASREDRVLFLVRGEKGEEWFVVVDMDPVPTVVNRFRLTDMWSVSTDTTWGHFSHDGNKVVIFGRKAYVVEVPTGTATSVATSPIQFPGAMTLLNVVSGTHMIVIQQDARQDIANWYRIGWNGQVLTNGSGAAVYPSPDGSHVAVFRGERPHESMNWSAIEAILTEDGSPVFRVTGASAWIAGHSGVNRWLSDNSGFVISDSRLQMSIALRDGSFRPYIGLPASDSPNRFAVGGGIRDINGNVVASAVFPASAADFVPPLGESSKEIRYLTPRGGHDCCQGAFSLIEPYIETPPYTPGLRLQLSRQAAGEQLLDQALTGQPVGVISGAGRVTVHETIILCTDRSSNPIPNCPPGDYEVHLDFAMRHLGVAAGATIGLGGYWARVTTADGQEGWLLLSVRPLGV